MTLINPSIRVANGQFAPNVATPNYVVPTPAVVMPGDLLIMAACMPYNGAVQPTITTVPSGWTSLWQTNAGPTTDPTQGAYTSYAAYKFASASEPASYTWVSSPAAGDRPICVMIAIQDTLGLDPLISGGGFVAGGNANVTTATPGTTFTTQSITPEGAGGFPLTPNGCFVVDFFTSFYGSTTGLVLSASAPFTGYGQFFNGNNGAALLIGGFTQATQASLSGQATTTIDHKSRATGILACVPTWIPSISVTKLHVPA